MPWRATSVMDQRISFILAALEAEESFSRLCMEHGISRQCGYKWLKRYREAGSFIGLKECSRRPRHVPSQTSQEVEGAVLEVRRRYGWGGRKIKAYLRRAGIETGEWNINRILKRRGLVTPPEACDGAQAKVRFAREEPNELHQMDFKGEYRIEEGYCYPLTLLDDHSRYLVGLWALPNQCTETVQEALERHFLKQGVPQALLLDRGVPWWSNMNEQGLTRLSIWLMNQDIALLHGRVRHPQTQGKVERFHRTLKDRTRHRGLPKDLKSWQAWAKEFRLEYNEIRPHEAIGMRTPTEAYSARNLRPYQPHPMPYDYGKARVMRLNKKGCMHHHGRTYFVCEALAEQRVRVDEVEELVLVTFRETTIREINLKTNRTAAVMLPARHRFLSTMSC